jgi:hypothetical protein
MTDNRRRKRQAVTEDIPTVPMEQIEKRMVDLKKTIDASKTHRAELVGAERQTLAALQERFGVDSIAAAETEHARRKENVQERRGRVQQLYHTLTQEFEW